ncbi:FkbM family methyltransferase [Actinoplanes sp. NPDC026623]|uniref:FkbM family methyltransferase n=1 Tax=Actinoplanes sp. NPDC026623 TaxID=3155610 RepID=UPI0033E958A4
MLISEVLPLTGEIRELVDTTPAAADFPRHLGVPDGLPQQRSTLVETEKLELGPGTLLVALVGDKAPDDNGPEQVAAALRRMKLGARALLLTAWPVAELLPQGLPSLLDASGSRCMTVLPIDEPSRHGVQCAVLVERTDVFPAAGHGQDAYAGDNRDQLILDLERLAEKRAEALRKSEEKLAKARKRLATMERSIAFRAGQVLSTGGRQPAKAVVSVPAGLARLWREGRSRPAGAQSAPAPAPATNPVVRPDRVVPITLPSAASDRHAAPALITMSAPPRMLVPRKLAQAGLAAYEPAAIACFLAALDVAGPGEVLDIGANVGIYAGIASALTRRTVRAFEPAPELAEVASRFAADNQLGYSVETLALGAENGTATFYMSDSSDTSNSLAEGFRKSSEQLTVTVETLDSYAARTGLVPAVMKVDTETTEPDVLAGAAATIAEHRPWILCEVLAGRGEDRLAEVVAPFGYHWFHVTSEVPYTERDTIEGDRTHEHLMYLFTPEVPDERFWTAVRDRTAELAECTA